MSISLKIRDKAVQTTAEEARKEANRLLLATKDGEGQTQSSIAAI
jgi:hypothetical protein